MAYGTNDSGEVDAEVGRKREPAGKVSKPFLIFWDRNFDGKYSCDDGEQNLRKGFRKDAQRFMELESKQAGEAVL
jgi:hypothetical protein